MCPSSLPATKMCIRDRLNRIKLMISVAKENMRAGKGFKLEKVAPLAMDEVTGQMLSLIHICTGDADGAARGLVGAQHLAVRCV